MVYLFNIRYLVKKVKDDRWFESQCVYTPTHSRAMGYLSIKHKTLQAIAAQELSIFELCAARIFGLETKDCNML